jgi:hypothetical protein
VSAVTGPAGLPVIGSDVRSRPVAAAVLAFAVASRAALAQAPQPPAPLPLPLPLFPPDNWWNADVSSAPVDPNSAGFISLIGAGVSLHPDFGGSDGSPNGIYGMPYVIVPGTQPLEPVTFGYDEESDVGAPGRPPGYPIPVAARTEPKWIEGGQPGGCSGGDDHMLIVDRDNRFLFELFATCWNAGLGRWEAGSGAVFPLDGNERRPEGWTSADAAGLAILPGLVRYDEVFGADPIRHALRFTVRYTNGHVYPASHTASNSSSPNALPMGARLRLKASKDISGFSPPLRKIFQALKTYGLIVADNGSNMYVTGAYDPRWQSPVVGPTWPLTAGDFEVVERGWRPPVVPSIGPTAFYTLTPCRLLDTRLPANQTPPGPYGGPNLFRSSERVLVVTGRCGIPATARAVAVNVTVVAPPGAGFVTLYPGDASPPPTSSVNFTAGQVRANNAVMMLSSSGSGALALRSGGGSATVHVVLDVAGYFQ